MPLGQAMYFSRALAQFGVEHELVVYPRKAQGVSEPRPPVLIRPKPDPARLRHRNADSDSRETANKAHRASVLTVSRLSAGTADPSAR